MEVLRNSVLRWTYRTSHRIHLRLVPIVVKEWHYTSTYECSWSGVYCSSALGRLLNTIVVFCVCADVWFRCLVSSFRGNDACCEDGGLLGCDGWRNVLLLYSWQRSHCALRMETLRSSKTYYTASHPTIPCMCMLSFMCYRVFFFFSYGH